LDKKIAKVKVKNINYSPQKLRLVVDLVRGLPVNEALDILQYTNRKGVISVKKAIMSGVANANDRFGLKQDDLFISKIFVDEGDRLRKVRFASRGRVSRLTKRRSHLKLELETK